MVKQRESWSLRIENFTRLRDRVGMNLAILSIIFSMSFLGCHLVNADDDVQVYLKRQAHGKGYFATCEIILKNKTKQPQWFLILSPDFSLDSNILKSNIDGAEAFVMIGYTNKNRNAVILEHYGEDCFSAIRVPADSFVCFENFELYSGSPIHSLIILETPELKINGKITFLEWSSFKCTSDSNVKIVVSTSSGEGEILAGDFFSERNEDGIIKKFPKGKIDFISISSQNSKKYSFDLTGRVSGQDENNSD